MNTFVYILGILLQAAASIIALYQLRLAPRKLPWLLISLSSLLIVYRRSATLSHFMKAGRPLDSAEIMTLLISLLFFFGVILMSRMFRELAREHSTLQESETAIRMVSSYSRSLIEASLDPLVTIDPNGRITDVNGATEAATGYSREELINTDFCDYFTEPDLARKGYQAVYRNSHVRDYQLELKHRDGHTITVLYNASVYRDERGRTIGVFAAARDITGRRQMEEALHVKTLELEQEVAERQRAQEELHIKHRQLVDLNHNLETRIAGAVDDLRIKDMMMIQQSRQAAMGEMINNIAHQWKQPLNNLSLIIQSLSYDYDAGMLSKDEMDSEIRKCLELITFMSDTIDDFRKFFLADRQLMTFGIRQNIARATRLMSASLKSSKVKVVVDQGNEIMVEGYPNEYAQVVLNLLSNARDVMLDRNVADPVIQVKVESGNGNAVVIVSDNGGGIRADVLERIFDPYVTTKEQGRGTGIGLYMSKTIIEEHMNGRLTAANTEYGARFIVEIPEKHGGVS